MEGQMNPAIPVSMGKHAHSGRLARTFDARDLHAFLDVGTYFTTWIAEKIKESGFIEGQDFVIISSETQRDTKPGPRPREYHISLHMAKNIAMLQKNDKGKAARKYFIDCEQRLNELQTTVPKLPQTYVDALRELLLRTEQLQLEQGKVEVQTAQIEAMAPHAKLARDFLSASGTVTVTQMAITYGKSAKWLNKFLAKEGVQRSVKKQWVPMGKWTDKGYTKTRHNTVVNQETGERVDHPDSVWTTAGQEAVFCLLRDRGISPAKAIVQGG